MIRKALRIVKVMAKILAGLVFILIASALLYRKLLQHNIAKDRVITSPNGIASLEHVRIGGIDQWIEIRGQNVNNPILLFIHGGPGIAFIPLAGDFQGPWEKNFTVVEWDQRGAGKTYASNDKELQQRTMNVPRMEQDTFEVVNYLRHRFKREKILIVGHSWGSVLGLWLAHEHPETMYAYVGVGQVVNMEQNAQLIYQDELNQARSRHDEQAVKELESIAPYPLPNADERKTLIANRWAGKLLGPPETGASFTDIKRILLAVVSAPEYSLADDFGFVRDQMFSLEAMLPEVSKVDLTQLGSGFAVPIFFFEGRHDPYCLPSLVQEYSQTITAPKKEVIWFEDSGHFPFFEEKQKFTNKLFQRVLPLAVSQQSGN